MAKKSHPAPLAAADALLELSAEKGWNDVSLADVAFRAGVSLAELYEQFGSKFGIFGAYLRHLDESLLNEPPSAEDSLKDRLFDVMMRRFESMQPQKPAFRAILQGAKGDPLAWLWGALRVVRTASLILESVGVNSSGPMGRLKAKALAALYLKSWRTWLEDDTADMAKTMADLDKTLRRAESLACFVTRGHNRRPAAPPQGEEEAKVS